MTNETTLQEQPAAIKKDIIIDRVFNLPVSKLWQAWTEPESLKKWWAPKDYTCPYCSIDLKVGGKYLNCMCSAKGEEIWSTGFYQQIIPEKKLVYTDSFSDDKGNVIPASDLNMPGDWPMECQVTVTFEETGGKTAMHLQHVGIPAAMHDDCINGWNQCFDKIEENKN